MKKAVARKAASYVARATERWGTLPDWIAAVADAADAEIGKGGTLTSLGKMVGLTGAQISGALGKTYPPGAAFKRIEATVRGKLMSAQVQCPALGMTIGRDQCAGYQRQKFSAASPMSMRLARACPVCPNAIGGKS